MKLVDDKKRDQSKSKDKDKKRDKSLEDNRKFMRNIAGSELAVFGSKGKSKSNMILKGTNEDKMPKLLELKVWIKMD